MLRFSSFAPRSTARRRAGVRASRAHWQRSSVIKPHRWAGRHTVLSLRELLLGQMNLERPTSNFVASSSPLFHFFFFCFFFLKRIYLTFSARRHGGAAKDGACRLLARLVLDRWGQNFFNFQSISASIPARASNSKHASAAALSFGKKKDSFLLQKCWSPFDEATV